MVVLLHCVLIQVVVLKFLLDMNAPHAFVVVKDASDNYYFSLLSIRDIDDIILNSMALKQIKNIIAV